MATQAKKMKNRTKYSDELKKQFSFISKYSSSISDHQYKFHCNVCNLDLSCASSGVNDVKTHADTPNHKRNEQSSKRKYIDMTLKLKATPQILFKIFKLFLSVNERLSLESTRTILFISNVVMDCRI